MKDLLRAAAKSSAGMLVTLLTAAIAVKIIALLTGPSGVGLFSLLRQTQQTASIMGALGGQAPIVQGLSSKTGTERAAYFVVISRAIAVCSIAVSTLMMLLAPYLAPLILGAAPDSVFLFRLLAIPTFIGSGVIFLSAVINSHKAVGVLSLVQIVAGLSLALLAYPLSQHASGKSFIFLLAISGCAGMAMAIFYCIKKGWLPVLKDIFVRAPQSDHLKHFLKVGVVTLLTSLIGMTTVLVVRVLINNSMGYYGAGIFDAAWTLSMTYVMIILTSFSTYYLPTLSAIRDSTVKRNELILRLFRFATYTSIPLITLVIFIKLWVIQLLYSKQFLPAADMMRWMLLGDYLKITAWVFAIPMLAYTNMKVYFFSELFWSIGFILLSAVLFETTGKLEYVGLAFLICYTIYFIFSYFYCERRYGLEIPWREIVVWVAGLVFLAAISYLF